MTTIPQKPFLSSIPKYKKTRILREWDEEFHRLTGICFLAGTPIHDPKVLLKEFKTGFFDRKKYPLTYKECLTQVRLTKWYWRLWFKIWGVKR